MLYRKLGKTNEKVSVLGFGCMRFPTIDGQDDRIDEERATKMLRYAIDNGVNYLDTAYPYHEKMSEPFLAKALQDGYREKVYLATKLPSWEIKIRQDMDYYLNEQLKRLQTDRIDFYLIHAFNQKRWENLKELGVFEFLDSAIADGRIKYAGFSFHDKVDLFKEIVDAYDWAVCQIQYNYLDEDFQAGRKGLEYAAKRGLGIIIMEPLRGGRLAAGIPEDIQAVWNKASIKRSPAEWALRFLWDHSEIDVVLSGMSNMEQVRENIEIAGRGYPNSLAEQEKKLIDEVKKIYKSKIKVNCTDCRYCLPCPEGVNIPACFESLNNATMFEDITAFRKRYHNLLDEDERASKCIGCGKCEKACPQNIAIPEMLKEVVESFEKI